MSSSNQLRDVFRNDEATSHGDSPGTHNTDDERGNFRSTPQEIGRQLAWIGDQQQLRRAPPGLQRMRRNIGRRLARAGDALELGFPRGLALFDSLWEEIQELEDADVAGLFAVFLATYVTFFVTF